MVTIYKHNNTNEKISEQDHLNLNDYDKLSYTSEQTETKFWRENFTGLAISEEEYQNVDVLDRCYYTMEHLDPRLWKQ